ncbi:MAG TPA: aminoglycoside phosphotransferase family protein [Mycobacteriales bacterium]|nr:aminoglycoside phosphotransferase family protein [Mycobacteriales bacterium]
MTVRLHAPARGSVNRHAEVDLPAGGVFVKLYEQPAFAPVERAVLDALAARYDWPVPAVDGGDGWLAFPLLDLAPGWSSAALPVLGARLAEVHATPVPEGVPPMADPVAQVPRRLDRLRSFDPRGADAAAATWERAVTVRAAARTGANVLLHNDFGPRNAVRRPDGTVALIDLERAGAGDPHWDLGKVWDVELADPADRRAFLAGYGARDWPHPETLWTTRFAAALAAVPFARRIGDAAFARWAYDLLDRLAAEL